MKLENHLKNLIDLFSAIRQFCCKCNLFSSSQFAAEQLHVKRRKHIMLMSMSNILPHPKVLFLSGFGKLNVCFRLCFS